MRNETEAYVDLLGSHLGLLVERLRAIPPDQWEWTPAVAAPSPRTIAEHTWRWLVSDRQHILEADIVGHSPVPEAPAAQGDLCDLLAEENTKWRDLMLALTPTQWEEQRFHFGVWPRNVRFMIAHVTQQVIYKHGQLSTLYFALGLDGTGPYTAPCPNEEYENLQQTMQQPVHRAVLTDDIGAMNQALEGGTCDLSLRSATGHTPLRLAVLHDDAPMVRLLLEAGAKGNEMDGDGNSLLIYVAVSGSTAAEALIEHGADLDTCNRWNGTALGFARMKENSALVAILTRAGAETALL